MIPVSDIGVLCLLLLRSIVTDRSLDLNVMKHTVYSNAGMLYTELHKVQNCSISGTQVCKSSLPIKATRPA